MASSQSEHATSSGFSASSSDGLRMRPSAASAEPPPSTLSSLDKDKENNATPIEPAPPSSPLSTSDSASEGDAEEFDPSAPPPFTLADLRAAVPKHCWVKDPLRSVKHFLLDASLSVAIAVLAYLADSWVVWPVYWFCQGVMFSCLFVVGHDCDHGSFSDSKLLNDIVGHLCHTPLLTPFHGWRISHRTHHSNHGHVENDETWHPLGKDIYDSLTWWKVLRFQLPLPLLAFPVYLWVRSPGKSGSHFHPSSPLFAPKESGEVLLSATCWGLMLALYLYLTALVPVMMIKMYWVPYVYQVMWLAGVTYLHHHAYDQKLPWYRGEEWSYLRGALTTVDRDYGVLKIFSHHIGTHVVHHLFPQMPHYHLVEATEHLKPVLGKYYREPELSTSMLPFQLIPPLLKSFSEDHYVPAEGNVVFYEKDKNLPTWWWWWGK